MKEGTSNGIYFHRPKEEEIENLAEIMQENPAGRTGQKIRYSAGG
jgi:hypothetical protein